MNFGQVPGSGTVQKNVHGPGVAGRPKGSKTATKKVAFLPHANAAKTPEFIQMANDLMKTYGSSTLPPGLQPRSFRERLNISKGMTGN